MNIVLLSDTATVNGGAAKIALDGARALAASGHRVYLVCGTGPIADDLRGYPTLTTQCVGAVDILEDPNRLRAAAHGWWNPASQRYVGDLLDSLDKRDTLVHVHSWTKALSAAAIRAALDRRFATVVTVHDFLLACPTGTLFIHKRLQKCTLRPMSAACICTNCDVRSYPHKLWRVGRYFVQDHFGRVPSNLRHFIFYSDLAREILRPFLPTAARFHIVPCAIDVPASPPVNVAENDTFVFLGRLTPEKGVEMFARAAYAEQVACRFIGKGIASEAIARANPNAILSGWMDHSEGLKALRVARALVLPSLWYETLGLVVLEAAAQGVPSIVPDSCAARESVIDGVTGLHFRSGDEGDLRRKIRMLRDPDTASRMGTAAYERFWAPPGSSLDLHRRRLEEVYKSVLNERMTG